MNGDEIGFLEQVGLGRVFDAQFGACFRLQVLTPGNDLHAEGLRHLGDACAEIAEPDDAERVLKQVGADGRLPGLAGLHAGILDADVAGEVEHQPDREFRGRMLGTLGAADDDAALLRRRHVDRGIAHARW